MTEPSTSTSTKVKWTSVQPLPDPGHGTPCARSSHGVSVVQNGSRLVVYGGELVARTPIGVEVDGAGWIVDNLQSDTPTWRRLNDNGASPPERIAHAQAVHQDKYVYIFGGRAGITMEEKAMNDVWMLNCAGEPGSETWSQVIVTGDVPEARSFHRMICVEDSLYVFGGCGTTSGRLNDLYRLDLITNVWSAMGPSALRGRGGPNLLALDGGTKLGVVAGFCGEETADGQVFDLSTKTWNSATLTAELEGMRPRSVCVSGSFPALGIAVIFGGEVDPSDRGHEGAGGFENDVVILDEKTGGFKQVIKAPPAAVEGEAIAWPEHRGWSDSAVIASTNQLYLFGGLTGDDENPKRMDDLWRLDFS